LYFGFSVDNSETVKSSTLKYTKEYVAESNSFLPDQAKPHVPVPAIERENTPKHNENVAPNAITNACLSDSDSVGFFQARNIVSDAHGGAVPMRVEYGVKPVEMVKDLTENPTSKKDLLPPTVYSAEGNSCGCGLSTPCTSSGNGCCHPAPPIHQQLQNLKLSPNCYNLRTNCPPLTGYMYPPFQPMLFAEQNPLKVPPLQQNSDLVDDDIDLNLLESLTPMTSELSDVEIPLVYITNMAPQDVTPSYNNNSCLSHVNVYPNTTLPPFNQLLDDILLTTPEEEQANSSISGTNFTQTQSAAMNHSSATSFQIFNPYEPSVHQVTDELLVETSNYVNSYPASYKQQKS